MVSTLCAREARFAHSGYRSLHASMQADRKGVLLKKWASRRGRNNCAAGVGEEVWDWSKVLVPLTAHATAA